MRIVTLLTIGLTLFVPTFARAYSEEPLCALRMPEARQTPSQLPDNMCVEPPTKKAPIPWTQPIDAGEAREALREAATHLAEGRPGDALLELRLVEHARPEVADRIALREAAALLQMGTPEPACALYERAAASLDRSVAAQGRIGTVRCQLRSGDRRGEEALQALFRRYPNLGEKDSLRLELAQAQERWGHRSTAAALYRSLDMQAPHTRVAADARAALERLRNDGATVRALSPTEALQRAEVLVREGTLDMAHEALRGLATYEYKGEQLGQLHVLRGRLARIEGRFDDLSRELEAARNQGAPPEATARLEPPSAATNAERELAQREKLQRSAELRIRTLLGRRTAAKLSNPQLRTLFEVALSAELKEPLDAALEAMAARSSLAPALRFDAALRAFGVGADVRVAELFAASLNAPTQRVPASYHYGRALERLGRLDEAEVQYLEVLARDRSENRYYAMWAEQRLWALESQRRAACVPGALASSGAAPAPNAELAATPDAAGNPLDARARAAAQPVPAALAALLAHRAPVAPEAAMEATFVEPAPTNDPTHRDAILARLRPLAALHGAAYPWLLRAVALVELDLFDEAADELNETYLAFRDAAGSPRLRSGLEAVFTGEAPPRRPADMALKRARLALSAAEREELASIAGKLGDPGVEVHFGRWRANERPRAYTEAVQAAAQKHGLDPNLLFAVMRVESIYNRRIVSYAGAVGLMQIMPRTGRLIADSLGVEDFQVTDLLDPHTNVEFAAWYLASLLNRFDGRLPLAIASYNGGPHNVRLWMRANHPNMPLDAFLERIPFTQTHRYVRRVLTHYAAYRAQQALPMTRLSVELPTAKPDLVAF